MDSSLRMVLISGSTRELSSTSTLLDYLADLLSHQGAQIVHWHLGHRPLPIADPQYHQQPLEHPDLTVREFVSAVDQSDGVVFGSPIYHNSYSGVLKNALDHLAIPQIAYKAVGLTSHGGNRTSQAVDHLRIVTRGLQGVAIPTQVCTAREDYRDERTSGYRLSSIQIKQRADRFVVEMMLLAQCLQQVRLASQSVA